MCWTLMDTNRLFLLFSPITRMFGDGFRDRLRIRSACCVRVAKRPLVPRLRWCAARPSLTRMMGGASLPPDATPYCSDGIGEHAYLD
jgi:hypothetical protein